MIYVKIFQTTSGQQFRRGQNINLGSSTLKMVFTARDKSTALGGTDLAPEPEESPKDSAAISLRGSPPVCPVTQSNPESCRFFP